MNNAIIIATTFIITIAIVVIFFYHMSQVKKRDFKTIEREWKAFNTAVTNKRVQEIKKAGTKLIYNEHITVEQVKKMFQIINVLEKDHPDLTELKWIIYNKRKDWSKTYPRNFHGPYM